jgi:hypothetical protein
LRDPNFFEEICKSFRKLLGVRPAALQRFGMRGFAVKTFSHMEAILHAHEARAATARHYVRAAVALWAAVSIAAIWQGSAEFFGRAGAVGTGSVLAAFAVASIMRQSYQTDLFKAMIMVLRGEHIGTPPLGRADIDHYLEIIDRLLARIDRRSKAVRFLEIAATLIATLQWAYGDLIVNKFLLCGSWKC